MKIMLKISILSLIFILLLPVTSFQEPEEEDLIARVAPALIKRAHKYHGIKFSIMNEEGRLYFWRNGKKCSLFTQGFLKDIKK